MNHLESEWRPRIVSASYKSACDHRKCLVLSSPSLNMAVQGPDSGDVPPRPPLSVEEKILLQSLSEYATRLLQGGSKHSFDSHEMESCLRLATRPESSSNEQTQASPVLDLLLGSVSDRQAKCSVDQTSGGCEEKSLLQNFIKYCERKLRRDSKPSPSDMEMQSFLVDVEHFKSDSQLSSSVDNLLSHRDDEPVPGLVQYLRGKFDRDSKLSLFDRKIKWFLGSAARNSECYSPLFSSPDEEEQSSSSSDSQHSSDSHGWSDTETIPLSEPSSGQLSSVSTLMRSLTTAAGETASFELPGPHEEHFIQDFILSFTQSGNLRTTWATLRREKLEPWLDKSATFDESGSSLGPSEKQFLQIIALAQLHYELVDDRPPLSAAAVDGICALKPRHNDCRSSVALRRGLVQMKELHGYWSVLNRLETLVAGGWDVYTTILDRDEDIAILPDYEQRFDYFTNCLNHLRTNLRTLLRYNLVDRMPTARILDDPAVYVVTDIEYRVGGNWLLESLYTPVENLLVYQKPPPTAEVRWPGDEKPFVEPRSSFKDMLIAKVILKNRLEKKLIDVTESGERMLFHGQRLKNYHIISKDLLLQLSRKLQQLLPTNPSSCPQIDHRFDNVVHHNRRKYYIINHWLQCPSEWELRGRCDTPSCGIMIYENWYTHSDNKVIAWLEGNLFPGPSPQHIRGPFDPHTWTDSSFEEDSKPFLGWRRYTEFRRLRDSIRDYVELEKPTDEQTDQILDKWVDAFWRYPFKGIPVITDYWVKRSPTDCELRRLKNECQDAFSYKESYWAFRSEVE